MDFFKVLPPSKPTTPYTGDSARLFGKGTKGLLMNDLERKLRYWSNLIGRRLCR